MYDKADILHQPTISACVESIFPEFLNTHVNDIVSLTKKMQLDTFPWQKTEHAEEERGSLLRVEMTQMA